MINSDRSSFVDFVETYNGEESTLYYLGKLVIKLHKFDVIEKFHKIVSDLS